MPRENVHHNWVWQHRRTNTEMIKRSFRNVRIAVAIGGSEDSDIVIEWKVRIAVAIDDSVDSNILPQRGR